MELVSYRLALDFQTFVTFHSFVQIQRNQCPLLRYDLLYPDKQLKHVFENFKISIRSDLNSNFVRS